MTGCSCWPPDETSSINTAVVTLPTPCARDGKGPGHQYGLPDLIEAGHHPAALLPTPTSGGGTGYLSGNRPDTWRPTLELAVQGYQPTKNGRPTQPPEPAALLPTPTAASYGSNQSLSPGAAVRPSLATLAARLLPTPTLLDPTDATTRTDRHRDRDAPGQASADRRHVGSRPQALPPALLPTPRTSDARGPAGHGRGGSDLRTAMWELLPTPRASDGVKGCPAQRGSKGDLTLPSAAVRLNPGGRSDGDDRAGARLLPTPRVAATRTGRRAATEPDSRSGPSLEQAAEIAGGALPRELDSWEQAPGAWQPRPGSDSGPGGAWGPYAQAVARWEALLGRPAPAPTQPGTHGRPVLAPRFVEWLMGLQAGWVTDLPLPRTIALRVLGNGVAPQQAAVALRLLLCPHRWAVNP